MVDWLIRRLGQAESNLPLLPMMNETAEHETI